MCAPDLKTLQGLGNPGLADNKSELCLLLIDNYPIIIV